MFKLAVFVGLVALVAADVSHLKGLKKFPGSSGGGSSHHGTGEGGILRIHADVSPDGNYQYGYETDTGIVHDESGTFQAKGSEEGVISAQGKYSFTSPEGEHVEISYVADENGFQAQGSHLPVAPEIPAAIQRAIEYNLAHPEPEHQGGKPAYARG